MQFHVCNFNVYEGIEHFNMNNVHTHAHTHTYTKYSTFCRSKVFMYLTIQDAKEKKFDSQYDSRFDNYNLFNFLYMIKIRPGKRVGSIGFRFDPCGFGSKNGSS